MKQIIYLSFALFALIVASCSSEEIASILELTGNTSITASIEEKFGTRSAVTDDGRVKWSSLDAIGVFGGQTKNVKFTYKSGDNSGTASFSGSLPQDETIEMAYYPYTELVELQGTSFSMLLPNEYNYTGESFAPMIGVPKEDNNHELEFKQIGGLIHFTIGELPEDADHFVISSVGENAAPLAGIIAIDDITEPNATYQITEAESYSVTYSINSLDEADGFAHFFVPLAAGYYPCLSVSLYGKDKTEPYFTRTTSSVNVSRAGLIQMPIIDGLTGGAYILNEYTSDLSNLNENDLFFSDSDNGILVLNSNTVAEPFIGQVLWAKASDAQPYGLLKKVTSVNRNSDGSYTIETEPAAIDEAFDKLYIDEDVEFIVENDNLSRAADSREKMGEFNADMLHMNSTIAKDSTKIGLKAELDGKIGLKGNYRFVIDKEKNIQEVCITPQMDAALSLKTSINLQLLDIEWESENKIGPRFAPILLAYGLVSIYPKLNFCLYGEASGNIEMEVDVDCRVSNSYEVNFADGRWTSNTNNNRKEDGLPFHCGGGLFLNGNLEIGIKTTLEYLLYNNEDNGIKLHNKLGFNLSGEISAKTENLIAQNDYKLNASIGTKVFLEAEANIFNLYKKKVELDLFETTLIEWDLLKFLPDFNTLTSKKINNEVSTRSGNDTSYDLEVLTSSLNDILLSNAEIQFRLENTETGVVEQESDWLLYNVTDREFLYDNEQHKEIIQDFNPKFKNLKEGVSYKVYPVIRSKSLLKMYGGEYCMDDYAIIVPETSLKEELMKIYNECGGENWLHHENWGTDEPLDTWFGVKMQNEKLIELNLFYKDEGGIVSNQLTGNLVVSGFPDLQNLEIGDNDLTGLTVTDCPSLRYISIGANSRMEKVKVNNCPTLTSFSSSGNNHAMHDLSFADFPELGWLYIYDGSIKSLDLSANPKLNSVHLYDLKKIEQEVNISECKNLDYFTCTSDLCFDKLDIPENLKELTVFGDIKQLSIPSNSALERLYCDKATFDAEVVNNATRIQSLSIRNCVNQESVNYEALSQLEQLGVSIIPSIRYCENLKSFSYCANDKYYDYEFINNRDMIQSDNHNFNFLGYFPQNIENINFADGYYDSLNLSKLLLECPKLMKFDVFVKDVICHKNESSKIKLWGKIIQGYYPSTGIDHIYESRGSYWEYPEFYFIDK